MKKLIPLIILFVLEAGFLFFSLYLETNQDSKAPKYPSTKYSLQVESLNLNDSTQTYYRSTINVNAGDKVIQRVTLSTRSGDYEELTAKLTLPEALKYQKGSTQVYQGNNWIFVEDNLVDQGLKLGITSLNSETFQFAYTIEVLNDSIISEGSSELEVFENGASFCTVNMYQDILLHNNRSQDYTKKPECRSAQEKEMWLNYINTSKEFNKTYNFVSTISMVGVFIFYLIGLIYILIFYQPKRAYIWLGLWSLLLLAWAFSESQITHIGLGLVFSIFIIIILLLITDMLIRICKYYSKFFK